MANTPLATCRAVLFETAYYHYYFFVSLLLSFYFCQGCGWFWVGSGWFRVGSGWFRLVPARFRAVPAGSGRFRVGSAFYIHPEERKFQTLVRCANLIKMKTHSQFILINWNITSPKMVKQHTWEISNAREISRFCFNARNSFLKFVWCVAAERNNNNKREQLFFSFLLIHPDCKNWKLRSEAESSAGKKTNFQCVN